MIYLSYNVINKSHIALLIVIALSFALDLFLGEYLLYRWDREGESEETEE